MMVTSTRCWTRGCLGCRPVVIRGSGPISVSIYVTSGVWRKPAHVCRPRCNWGMKRRLSISGGRWACRTRLEEAVQAYQRAIDAGVIEAIVNQGAVWQQLGDLEQARQRYQQAIEAGDLLGHIRLGQLLEKAGQVSQAQAHYEIALQGGWPSAPSALGLLLARQESWREAELLLRVAAEFPDDADARSWLGLTLHRLGRVEEARAVLTAAADADEWESFIPLGNLLWDEDGDLAGAEDVYRQAREAGDENAYPNLGLLLLETGQLEAARTELTLALEQGGRNRTAALEALARVTDNEDPAPGRPYGVR